MSKRSPRLLFTEEERAAPELQKVIKKADKQMDKLDKAEAKIPKKTEKKKERVVDEKTGKVTTRLYFEEVDKKRPQSKLTHEIAAAPVNTLLATSHREVRESEDDNVGVESAHKLEEAAEGGVRTVESAYRSHQLKPYRNADRAEAQADKANIKALQKEAQRQNPEFSSNPYSRWQQKRAIKKEYAAAKAGKSANKTAKASETTAKAAKKAAEETKKAGEFIARHKKGFLIVGGIAFVVVFFLNVVSSCSMMLQGGISAFGTTTYPVEDSDLQSAEAQYTVLEDELQAYIDTYESTHSYDEYHYTLGEIEHDPYVLMSAITALHGDEWTVDEVGSIIQTLFDLQYDLSETVIPETRYRTETRTGYQTYIDQNTGAVYRIPYEYEVEVPYTYYICYVTLTVTDLESVATGMMTEEQKELYDVYMLTKGNKPDLFEEVS